jgi:hypothetical protein
MSKNANAVDQASPAIHASTNTDSQKVSVARDVTTAAKGNPGWATALDLQAATKAWNAAADGLEANATIVTQLRSQLRAAVAKQLSFRRSWMAARKQVLGTADVLCAGSADELKAYGFGVRTRAPSGKPISTPHDVSAKPGKGSGEVIFSWPKGDARHGFVVQHGTDAANPATLSASIPCTGSKFTLATGTTGAHVVFRVAAIDPSSPAGQTAWSAWFNGTAR